MFRNQYDSDVTVWSPQGRLHQVDYAVEAMKQGSATVGIKSNTHAVLVALKRAANDLCSHQKKIYELDKHAGVSIAGLLSDGRILARFLQTECSSWRWDFKEAVPIQVLNNRIQLKLQANTQYYGRRPFGVGLVIAGYDRNGPHIVRTDPSAEVVECLASSIGARSQSARTYLEKNLESFKTGELLSTRKTNDHIPANPDQLIEHALMALKDTLPAEDSLSKKVEGNNNTTIAIVGHELPFKVMDDDEVAPYLDRIPRAPAQPQQAAAP
ncbi:Proteasome subunit alpha type [Aphelenchoides besseyi]|nr:Proteasome subunit alpha type [Aphelenchoides besseyi]KAI6226953.1 Proteasome subunit alpha type [Aphelenchoides besseyi]